MKKDIEKLRCDKEYYNGVGKSYLSNSDIGTLLKNPKYFGVSAPDNQNFAKGRLFHQLILEPKKAREFIGYVPEGSPLYNEMTTIDFLSFICEIRNIDKGQNLSKIIKLLDLGMTMGPPQLNE